MTHKPTPEQSEILEAVASTRDNLMIRARAGCGKTSTLTMIDHALPNLAKTLICFNKAIAEEAKTKVLPTTQVKTFNGLGHAIWKDACGRRLTLNTKKIVEIYRSIVDEAPPTERKVLWALSDQVYSGVNFARALGYVPPTNPKASRTLCDFAAVEAMLDETATPEVEALINRVLNLSIAQAYSGVVDFNDQVYMPAVFAAPYPAFPMVLIDEYQDLSPVNQAIVDKLCKRSRQIGVGDEAQAIYGFRGADEAAMARAIDRFSMRVLPLTLTFRCPTEIVKNVHWRVPDYRAYRTGGHVYSLGDPNSIVEGSAVICRNNAPLLGLAMGMVMEGHSVNVSGVDIGAKLLRLMEKLGPETLTQTETVSRIIEWRDEKLSMDSKTAADLAACMLVFASHGNNLAQAIAYAKHLFEATHERATMFMTGHKSKGLEFESIYHLDPELLNGPRKGPQDPNLHYVIDTRTSETLTYIRSEDRKSAKQLVEAERGSI